ncbi:LANO_0F17458g1_1 [Lachancea nothofagi CBS 11611]|uniref:LANO_0F17458g1_1 n=1 Tax=Lachancea nothofagi CBS 11611 TaxID=1266666 RepID=A0A1G4KD03_9SACH|nr:LANO_0F17458g1_1 [Lachancea nothofagi CBS 11611]
MYKQSSSYPHAFPNFFSVVCFAAWPGFHDTPHIPTAPMVQFHPPNGTARHHDMTLNFLAFSRKVSPLVSISSNQPPADPALVPSHCLIPQKKIWYHLPFLFLPLNPVFRQNFDPHSFSGFFRFNSELRPFLCFLEWAQAGSPQKFFRMRRN